MKLKFQISIHYIVIVRYWQQQYHNKVKIHRYIDTVDDIILFWSKTGRLEWSGVRFGTIVVRYRYRTNELLKPRTLCAKFDHNIDLEILLCHQSTGMDDKAKGKPTHASELYRYGYYYLWR
jgi:hypothetical protein